MKRKGGVLNWFKKGGRQRTFCVAYLIEGEEGRGLLTFLLYQRSLYTWYKNLYFNIGRSLYAFFFFVNVFYRFFFLAVPCLARVMQRLLLLVLQDVGYFN